MGSLGRRPVDVNLVKSGVARKLADGGGFKAGISDMSISSFELDEYKYEKPEVTEEEPRIRSKAEIHKKNKMRGRK